MKIKTPIIPIHQTFAKIDANHNLNLEAICIFAAIGFFLDKDTYWKDEVVLSPASKHIISSDNMLLDSKPWFTWHYTPRDISFKQALDEFSQLFETIIKEQVQNKKVILPLSGGIDSRTQAVALKQINADVFSYSYQYPNGFPEAKIAREIAKACDFEFKKYEITKGYLWDEIDCLFKFNKGYSDFTAPRQMAIYNEFSTMGDVFSLGHWGDVLFDSMSLPKLTKEEQVEYLFKKLIKKGGLELSTELWESWNLQGDFSTYFKTRITTLLNTIHIEDTNAKLRAFKSKYWAPRWTSINLSVFNAKKPISLPYYDDRMCEFICTIPEEYLKNRKLQIAYIKAKSPKLAKIEWQEQKPYNLYNFHLNKYPYNLPYKIINKLKRTLKASVGKVYVQRNWELQFLGEDNLKQLENHLFKKKLDTLVPKALIDKYFNAFTSINRLQNAHAMNVLLVLSKFNQDQQNVKKD